MARLPLSGFRVIDFSWVVAGPFSASLLASMGAETIKIESRTRIEHSRRSAIAGAPPPGEVDMSPRFLEMNLNKLGVQLDIRQPEAIRLLKRLAGLSDAVIENFRGGVMERLGLGYETLRQINPGLIMLSSSVGGGVGPQRGQPGYAPVFNAASGLGYITGYEDGPPTELRSSVDLRVALTCAYALLSALYHRRRTGRGQHIDVSSTEAVSSLIGHVFLEQQMTGRSPGRQGNRHPFMAPHDCYRCVAPDSWVSIAVSTQQEWEALCRTIGKPDLEQDPRFADELTRWKNQDLLRPDIEAWTAQRTHWEATEQLQAAGIAAAPSFTFEDVANDAHVVEREVNVRVEHARMGEVVTLGVPWKLSRLPAVPYRPAPLFGEHNTYVYGELLGLDESTIAALGEQGVIN